VLTHDVTLVEGSPYRRLIARDDKPLPPAEEKKEREKLDKSIAERQRETPAQRASGWRNGKSNGARSAKPWLEIPDAFESAHRGHRARGRKEAWIIEGTPRPGFRPKSRTAPALFPPPPPRLFPKFKGRLWIDKQDSVWVKMECRGARETSPSACSWRVSRRAPA